MKGCTHIRKKRKWDLGLEHSEKERKRNKPEFFKSGKLQIREPGIVFSVIQTANGFQNPTKIILIPWITK